MDAVHKHKRADRVQGAALPFFCFRQDLVCDLADHFSEPFDAVKLLQLVMDIPGAHAMAYREITFSQSRRCHDVKLVKVAPRRRPVLAVGIHRRSDKLVGDVHRNLAEVPGIFLFSFQSARKNFMRSCTGYRCSEISWMRTESGQSIGCTDR